MALFHAMGLSLWMEARLYLSGASVASQIWQLPLMALSSGLINPIEEALFLFDLGLSFKMAARVLWLGQPYGVFIARH